MNSFISIWITIMISFFLINTHILAQENDATLSETLEWLKQKVEEYPPAGTEVELRANGCILENRTKSGRSTFEYTIPLNSLDPVSVKVEESRTRATGISKFVVKFDTTQGAKTIKERQEQEDPKAVEMKIRIKIGSSSTGSFEMRDKEIAMRVASSLKHAIKLCGGKVEPF